MTDLKYDVAGIGNALVDVISNADDAFLTANGIEKGVGNLTQADSDAEAGILCRRGRVFTGKQPEAMTHGASLQLTPLRGDVRTYGFDVPALPPVPRVVREIDQGTGKLDEM